MYDASPPSNPYVPIVGSLIGLIGTVAGLAFNWIKDANEHSKRTRALEDANKLIAFWESRLRIQMITLTGDSLEEAKRETMQRIEEVRSSVEASHKHLTHAPGDQHTEADWSSTGYLPEKIRQLFFLSRPRKAVFWIPRFFLFCSIIWSALVCFAAAHELHLDARDQNYRDAIELLTIIFGPTVLFLSINLWLDRKSGKFQT